MNVRGIGYFGLAVPDREVWVDYAQQVIGLQVVNAPSGGNDDATYLAADDRHWRVAVHEADTPGLAYLGLEVVGRPAFDAAVAQLDALGIAAEQATKDELAERAVQDMVHVQDPAGNRVEVFWGPDVNDRFCSPVGAQPFISDGGFGHLVLLVADIEANLAFYQEVLGFRLTDFSEFGDGMSAHFLRSSSRHHSVALSAVGGIEGLHHLAFEATDIDEVGKALERATQAEVPITASLGRHKNDRMLSFYMRSPAGFDVEVGCDPRLIDEETWIVSRSCEGDVWGHHGLTAESMADSRAAALDGDERVVEAL